MSDPIDIRGEVASKTLEELAAGYAVAYELQATPTTALILEAIRAELRRRDALAAQAAERIAALEAENAELQAYIDDEYETWGNYGMSTFAEWRAQHAADTGRDRATSTPDGARAQDEGRD